MTPYEIIRSKRDGQELDTKTIQDLISSYTSGQFSDYQMSAFCMAVYFKGLTFRETTDLTLAMRDSGKVADLSAVNGVKVDKHSTGGVGDKISLVLAPLAASLGVIVPMVSGRGLGHTGGTLDKLESIPGFNVNRSITEFVDGLKTIGVSMIGQTNEIAPADKKLYALRDVTATVESIPLIAASIMSKKLASGLDALVLDVKVGRGAFMKTLDQAAELATYLVEIGDNAGKVVTAVLTNMDEPIGYKIGNWLEVEESLATLEGKGPSDVTELTATLCGEMLLMAGIESDREKARFRSIENLNNGKALEKFFQMTENQGGDVEFVRNADRWRKASFESTVNSDRGGIVLSIDTHELGMIALSLGAGRVRKEDSIDPLAGIILHKKVGEHVELGEPLATIRTNRVERSKEAIERVTRAYHIDRNAPDKKPLIHAIVNRGNLRNP